MLPSSNIDWQVALAILSQTKEIILPSTLEISLCMEVKRGPCQRMLVSSMDMQYENRLTTFYGGPEGKTQPAITCSKVTIKAPEQGVKYV